MNQIKALMQPNDVEILLGILQPRSPKTILEIGTWQGFSAKIWDEELKPDCLITVEMEERESLPEPTLQIEKAGYHYLWGYDSTLPSTISKVSEILNGKQVDLLFIDGGHDFNVVKKDWISYSPLVREGGIIVLHDVVELREDMTVKPLFDFLKTKYPYVEIKGIESSSGIGIIFV